MRKVWVIAGREFRATVRSKSFLIAILLMPVFMFGGIGVQRLTEGRVDLETKRIAVLDRSGKLMDTIQEAVAERNEKDIFDEDSKRQNAPRYEVQAVPVAADRLDAQRLALSDRVRNKELFAFVEIPPQVMAQGDAVPAGILYYSGQPTYDDVARWLGRVVNDRVRSVRLAEAGIDRRIVDKAMIPVDVQSLGLLTTDAAGNIQQAKPVNRMLAIFVPFGLAMLMFVSLSLTTQPLLHGVIEEKMNRISEVLLGSVRPFDMMLGKLIGYVGVAVLLVVVYMGGGYALAQRFGIADSLPVGVIGWFGAFLVCAILMYGSLFLAAGSCCNDLREVQNLVLPIWLILMIPMFALGTVLEHPGSQFAVWLSLFPPATPMLMVIREAIPPGVPLWQLLVGLVGTIAMTLLCVWAAGRVFRVGLLMQGRAPKIHQLVRWAIRG